ncbi:MAG: hypothetical protein KDD62_11560 [Bdellovibrionales bacterium]|nr:hypothetical protein [Bdellovibrionales bacterium]
MIKKSIREKLLLAPLLLTVGVLVSGTRACQKNYYFAAQASSSPSPTPTSSSDDSITRAPTDTPSESDSPVASATASIAAFFRSSDILTGLAGVSSTNSAKRARMNFAGIGSEAEQPRTDAGNWLGNAYNDESVPGASLDSDDDGFTDALEEDVGSDPFDAESTPPPPVTYLSDRLAGLDDDADGLSSAQEDQLGTSPSSNDTDNDGYSDGAEVLSKSDPLDKNSKPHDRDGDGLSSEFEAKIGTDPMVADTDADGVNDDLEVALKLNPLSNDTDKDGILDGKEVALGSDPLIPEGG